MRLQTVKDFFCSPFKTKAEPLPSAPSQKNLEANQLPTSSFPSRFGIWETIPSAPDSLRCKFTDIKGFIYHVSFSHDPASQVVSSFEVKVEPGLEVKNGEAPTFPAARITNLTPEISQIVITRVFALSSEKDPHRKLLELINHLWLDTPLNCFDGNPTLLQLRLDKNPKDSGVELLKQSRNIPVELAQTIIERAARTYSPFLFPLQELLNCAHNVEASARGAFTGCVLAKGAELLPPIRFAELCLARGYRYDSPYGNGLDETVISKLIAGIFLQPKDMETAKLLSNLVSWSNRFSEVSQRYTCELVTNKLLERNEIETLASLVTNTGGGRHQSLLAMNGPHQRQGKARAPCWPQSAYKALLDNHLSTVLRHAHKFDNLDVADVADRALTLPNGTKQFADSLDCLKGIKGSVGVLLAEKLLEAKVVANIGSFAWSADDVRAFINVVDRTNQFPILVENLHTLPERFLQAAESKWHLATFHREYGMPHIPLFFEFLNLKRSNNEVAESALKGEIRQIRDAAVSGKPISEELATHRYYRPIIEHLYHNNSNRSTSYESNERCSDRTGDLAQFKIRPVYALNLTSTAEMILKPGVKEDPRGLRRAEAPLKAAQERLAPSNWEEKAMHAIVGDRLKFLGPLVNRFSTLHEKLFGAFIHSSLGKIDRKTLKEIVVEYQLATHPPMKEHIAQTREEAGQAKHPRYAYLMALHEYYNDMLHDCVRSLCETVSESKEAILFLSKQYPGMRSFQEAKRRKEIAHRMQADKVGVTHGLTAQIVKTLLTPDAPRESRWAAVRDIVEREQRKAAQFTAAITGKTPPAHEINLSEFSAREILSSPLDQEAPPPPAQLLNFSATELEHLFDEELRTIEQELKKYKPSQNDTVKSCIRINAYISKNKASAHARMVGGVCVSGDNPPPSSSREEENQEIPGLPHHLRRPHSGHSMWDLPNYFQLVLHDSATGRCEGIVMLHAYQESFGKVLTASFNPTSSLLFKVNEGEFFKALLRAVVSFASDNGFDYVCSSRERGIRTNRTAGDFEGALDKQIRSHNKQLSLSDEQVFSYHPLYHQKELDVLWARKSVK